MLTGVNVYAGDTIMKKLIAHREAGIPKIRDHRAAVSEALDVVFQKMIQKRPEDRQQSMQEVSTSYRIAWAVRRHSAGSVTNRLRTRR